MGNDVDITEVADGSKPYHELGLEEACTTDLAVASFDWYGNGGKRSLQEGCNS